MRKEELRNRIIDLKWHALPYYERWMYPKDICKEKNIHVKYQLQTQKWQVRQLKTITIFLLVLSIASSIYPGTSLEFTVFLVASGIVFMSVAALLQKRVRLLRQAVKLRKKLKKRS